MRGRQQPAGNNRARRRPMHSGPRVRLGFVAARSQDFGGLGDVERVMFEEGFTLAPMACEPENTPGRTALNVMPTADVSDIEQGKVSGLIVPGDNDPRSPEAATTFDKLVNAARAEDVPLMAFGDGVTRTLEAFGIEPTSGLPPAVLIHQGVRILETEAEMRDAMSIFRRPRPAAAAA